MLSMIAFLLLPLVGFGVRLRHGPVASLVAIAVAATIIDSDFRWHWLSEGGNSANYPLGIWPVAVVAAAASVQLARRRVLRFAQFVVTIATCFFAATFAGMWQRQTPRRPALANPDSVRERVRNMTGCWRFVPHGRALGYADERYLRDSVVVRFDTVAAPAILRARDGLALRAVFDSAVAVRRGGRLAHWALAWKGERVIAYWGNGYTGVELHLTQRGDSLQGRAYHTSDFGTGFRQWTSVTGVRTLCNAAR